MVAARLFARALDINSSLRRGYRTFVPAALRDDLWVARRQLSARISGVVGSLWDHLPRGVLRAGLEQRLGVAGGRGWLFVLGVNNSGTTLLSRLLESHPDVRGMPTEGQQLTPRLPKGTKYGVGRLWSEREDIFRWTEVTPTPDPLRVMLDWVPQYPSGRGYLLEKSPPNTLRSRWLQAHFRPARFISITRDGYAVSEGIRRRRKVDVARAARHWARANAVLLDDLPHLERHLPIRYEALATDPLTALARIADFLDLPPFDPAIAETPHDVHNLTREPSEIKDFNAASHARLTPEDRQAITNAAGPVLDRLGYPRLS